MTRFELTIENERPLSFMELKEIVELIDRFILETGGPAPPYPWRYPYDFPPPYPYEGSFPASFVEIESVRQGSIILTIAAASGAIFALSAFGLGIRHSRFGPELARLGENVGDILSVGIEELNNRLEGWSETNLNLRQRKTRARLRKLESESQVERR